MKILFFVHLLILILASCSSDHEFNHQIDPPFKNVFVPVNQFEVKGNEDKIIRLNNGSSLSIPKNAFVDKNGKVVSGTIKLEYREFSKAADIIASGIPMVYEGEGGANQQLESGGMFELRGKVNNEEVFIAKDKSISVNMSSDLKGEYDFYFLEEENDEDLQVSQASFFVAEAYAQTSSSKSPKVRWKKLTEIVNKDEEENKDKLNDDHSSAGQRFQLKFDTVKFPETSYLTKVNFQLATDDLPMNPLTKENSWVAKEKWERLEIQKAELKPRLLKSITYSDKLDNWFQKYAHKLPDSSGVIVKDGIITLYDFTGKKISSFGDSTIGSVVTSPTTERIIAFKHDSTRNGLLFSKEGKLIKNLGPVREVFFLNGGERILFSEYKNLYKEALVKYFFADKNGKVLAEYITQEVIDKSDRFVRIWDRVRISKDDKYVLLISKPEIKLLDFNGNVLYTYPYSTDIDHLNFLNSDNSVCFLYKKGGVKISDWQNNKTYSTSYSFVNGSKYDYHFLDIRNGNHPSKPEIILMNPNGNGFYIWNWKNNTFYPIVTNQNERIYYNSKHPFIYGSPTGEGLNRPQKIWNDEGKLIAETNDYFEIDYTSDNQLVLLNDNKKVFLKSRNGNEIKDFENYDTSIFKGIITPDNKILTISQDGIVNCWDRNSDLINTFHSGENPIHLVYLNNQYFASVNKQFTAKIWNDRGQFLIMDRIFNFDESKDKKYFITNNFKTLNFWQFPADTTIYKNVYQLLLYNEKSQFISYVQLSTNDLDLISQYSKIKNEKLAVESKRVQEENNLIRSFQIKKFGIYNWDRFYKNDDVIKFVADFDFGSEVNAYNNISIFLITGQDQNTVIRYSKSDLDKFSFDPSSYNQMIAVLPENKIAFYDQADFKDLNLDEIRKSHKFTFKMKVLEIIKSLDQLNKILTRPV